MSTSSMIIQTTARPVVKKVPTSFGRLVLTKYGRPAATIPSFVGAHATRSFSTAPPRYNTLSTKPTDAKAFQGVEGPHKKDITPQDTTLTREDAVSTVPEFKGDWVLFHPVYSPEELKAVQVMHRDAATIGDKAAAFAVRFARKCFDFVSGYKHRPIPPNSNMSIDELISGGYILSEKQWLSRILFLESIAGVPGMVAATLRHLRSLRLMKRDSGWIHTLLEEAENERMHLMTFMSIKKPSIWFRLMVLGAQGVFYNAFFFTYLISPRLAHRFVGYLEEEAVVTYTRCIKDLEAGRIPGWTNYEAPEISKDYWRLKPDAKILDVIYAVRSDETTHRFVNHSLANLNYKTDVNPFALREPDMHVKGGKLCFERTESEKYVQDSHKLMEEKGRSAHYN